MTKKHYIAPEAEIERFLLDDVITKSGGIGDGGNEGGDIDSIDEGDLDAVVDNETGEIKAYLDDDANEISQEDLDAIY